MIIFSLVGILFIVYIASSKPETKILSLKLNENALIYFHGLTCPNCKALNTWIKENDIESKVKFEKREVYYNEGNASLLEQAAAKCGIPNNQVGVPFIYDQGTCYIGVPDAQKILLKKASKEK